MNMISLYGFILLIFVLCTYISLERFFREFVFKKEFTPDYPFMVYRKRKLRIRKSHIFALLTVLILILVLNTYLGSFSPEAVCCKEYKALLSRCEKNKQAQVLKGKQMNNNPGMLPGEALE
jgi:hypothetical protein